MGMNISRCEADPTILPPPPPPPGQGGGSLNEPPQQQETYVSEKLKNNPGSYEELHKKCKGG